MCPNSLPRGQRVGPTAGVCVIHGRKELAKRDPPRGIECELYCEDGTERVELIVHRRGVVLSL